MRENGPHGFRIVLGADTDWRNTEPGEVLLVCPWLAGLDLVSGPWLAALPIHDCNGFLDGGWYLTAPDALRARCYVGIFALDRLRSTRQILGPLREKGVTGLINLPSVAFFDGGTARTFARLDLSLDAEIAFLAQAREAGFATALCAPDKAALPAAQRFDFVLRHRGPDEPFRLDAAGSSPTAAARRPAGAGLTNGAVSP